MLLTDPRDGLMREVDLALVHALQVNARAPWSQIASVIGVDAGTAARRWAAINEQGLAWFSVWPTPERHAPRSDAALVRVASVVRPETLDGWLRTPWVLGVERTSAGLTMLVIGHGGLAELERRIVETFPPVHAPVVEYAAAVPREDSCWRLQSLSAGQSASLRPDEVEVGARVPREEVVEEVTTLLREDARMSLGTLAQRMGVSDATARRTVERLVGRGLLRVGCDVSMPAVGLGRGVVVRARVRGGAYERGNDAALRTAAVHRVLNLVGPAPLTVSCRLGSLTQLVALEREWGEDVEVVDRWTVTETLKRNGHLLGPDGRSVGQVDVDW